MSYFSSGVVNGATQVYRGTGAALLRVSGCAETAVFAPAPDGVGGHHLTEIDKVTARSKVYAFLNRLIRWSVQDKGNGQGIRAVAERVSGLGGVKQHQMAGCLLLRLRPD